MRTYAVSPTRSRRRQDAPPGHFWPGAGVFYGLPSFRRSSSASLAKFTAMRRASSREIKRGAKFGDDPVERSSIRRRE